MQHDPSRWSSEAMKLEIWLDNHISPIIAKWLSERTGFEVKSSYKLKLYNLYWPPDENV